MLDDQATTSCTNPVIYNSLKKGDHEFFLFEKNHTSDETGTLVAVSTFGWTVNP